MGIPHQRKPGQTGGWLGQSHNKAVSRARGGSPRAGGGGGGKKGCLIWIAVPLLILTAAGSTAAWYLI